MHAHWAGSQFGVVGRVVFVVEGMKKGERAELASKAVSDPLETFWPAPKQPARGNTVTCKGHNPQGRNGTEDSRRYIRGSCFLASMYLQNVDLDQV
jgi:hypothetical protein